MYFKIIPENCGTFGRKTLYGGELTDRPPQIYRLDFEFTSWPSDPMFGVNCQYIGTEAFCEALRSIEPRVNGLVFEKVTICTSLEFRQANPGKEPPPCSWLKIVGNAGVHDFGMSKDHCLIVSDRVMAVIKPQLSAAQISIYITSEATGAP